MFRSKSRATGPGGVCTHEKKLRRCIHLLPRHDMIKVTCPLLPNRKKSVPVYDRPALRVEFDAKVHLKRAVVFHSGSKVP